jgi:hypothetical protein
LLLNNAGVRDILDAITAKVVVILGRFTPERKPVLDAVRAAVRNRNYTPLMFDFARRASRNLIETVTTLVSMCKFVIADVTDEGRPSGAAHNRNGASFGTDSTYNSRWNGSDGNVARLHGLSEFSSNL